MNAPEAVLSRRYPYAGLGALLAILFATEIAHHVADLDDTLSAGLFLLALVPIAYSALKAGFRVALAASLTLALYTMHYVGPHETLVSTTAEAWRGAAVILGLGVAMTYPMDLIRRREQHLREELTRRNEDLQLRNQELTEANAALEAFGYVVSHDLKEPVRAIENYLHAALEDWGGRDSKRDTSEAYAANQRLSRLLQGLLDLSRASSGTTQLKTVALAEALQSDGCRARYDAISAERDAQIDIGSDLPTVQGDETVLCQIFGNLILNAIRHNPTPRPRIVVRAIPASEARAHIMVEDNGPGFPPEVLTRFRRDEGAGLSTVRGGFGLIITARAAQRLGGRMWVENLPGGGGAAHVELPLAPEASMSSPPVPSAWTGRGSSRDSSRRPT